MRGAPFWRIKNTRFFIYFQTKIREKRDHFYMKNTQFFIHFQTKIREKRDHFQTKTPDFSSISKPKIGKT